MKSTLGKAQRPDLYLRTLKSLLSRRYHGAPHSQPVLSLCQSHILVPLLVHIIALYEESDPISHFHDPYNVQIREFCFTEHSSNSHQIYKCIFFAELLQLYSFLFICPNWVCKPLRLSRGSQHRLKHRQRYLKPEPLGIP